MAVYERNYRLWTGESTPAWSRFLILPRYAVREVFRSRLLLAYFVACFIFPVGCAVYVYGVNNTELLDSVFGASEASEILKIDADFFLFVLRRQVWASLFLAIFVGPGLVSRDLANNGLPLILSRPFSRVQYVVAKMLVLCTLVGAVAWGAPVLILLLHANLQDVAWIGDNLQLVVGVVLAPWVWVICISLFALAMSAWVKWKAVAGFGMLFAILAGIPFSLMIGQLFRTDYAGMINPLSVMDRVMASWIGGNSISSLPTGAAWTAVLIFVGLSLFLLERKLRAYQVVR